jgi:hypothetical protein
MQTTNLQVRKRIATLFFLFTIVFLLLGTRIGKSSAESNAGYPGGGQTRHNL